MPARCQSQKRGSDLAARGVLVVASVLVIWMFIIAGRLVFLQVFQHNWLRERARVQQQDIIATVPQRGLVYDRQGRELARSIDTESLYIEPQKIENVHAAAVALAPLIEADTKNLETKLD